jgi:hypothetical protein
LTLLKLIDPGFLAGAFGTLSALICLLALKKDRVTAKRIHAELRAELQAIVLEHKAGCSEQIAQLSRSVTVLELSAQNVDQAGKGGLTRSLRSQATQLLRTGMSPESAASTLGIGRREMRLIARVSRTLSIK